MKLFGFNISRGNAVESETFQAFSTPFKKVGDANLALPKIDGLYREAGSYVPFGEDNLFPQLLNQLYYTSPLHGATIDFKTNATLGGGYELEMDRLGAKGQIDAIAFTKKIDIKQTIKAVTKDILIHNRVYFLGCIDAKGKVIIKRRISPEKIRKNNSGEMFLYCDDWSRLMNIKQLKPFKYAEKGEDFLWSYEIPSVGQDLYSLPQYTSANNWIFLDGEMSYLQKSNIVNSIFPNFAIMFPRKPQGEEEMDMIRKSINGLKGAENGGKSAAFFANRAEDLPKFEVIPTSTNDGLFQNTTESIENKICQAHTIDPILMGIRVSGKLGSGTDIKQSYIIFEKNVIMPLREEVEYVFNGLFDLVDIDAELVINDYQIIGEQIVDKTEE